jgi:transposase
MPRTRPPYPKEFRQQTVALAQNGRSPKGLAEEFEPSAATIRHWLKQADLDDGVRDDGLTTKEHRELRRLRKENRRLQQERDILAMRRNPCGTAWFARETKLIPERSSNS